MKKEKFTKTAAALSKIFQILKGFAVAGIIVCAVMSLLVFILGDKMVADTGMAIGPLSFQFVEGYMPEGMKLKLAINADLLAGAIYCLVMRLGLGYVKDLIDPLKEGPVFSPEMPKLLKKLAILTVVGGFVSGALKSVAEFVTANAFDLFSLIHNPAIAKVTYNFDIDMPGILVGVLLYFLAWVFSYGAELQKEADETL